MRSLRMTKHARTRAAQRSIRSADLKMWEHFADREEHAPGGATYLQISHSAAEEARAAGIPFDQLRRLRRIRVVVADGAAITVYRTAPIRNRKTTCKLASKWGLA
jgi:hypothetical protein